MRVAVGLCNCATAEKVSTQVAAPLRSVKGSEGEPPPKDAGGSLDTQAGEDSEGQTGTLKCAWKCNVFPFSVVFGVLWVMCEPSFGLAWKSLTTHPALQPSGYPGVTAEVWAAVLELRF